MCISPYPELIRMPYPEPYPDNFRCLIRTPYPASRPSGRPAGQPASRPAGQPADFGGPGAGPGPPPGFGHRRWKTFTRKPSLENRHRAERSGGSFWPKLVKSRAFKPNGRHEQFRSALFIGKSSVGCSKALTRTPFVTKRFEANPAPGIIMESGVWGMGGRVIQTLSGRLMWISLGWVSGPGDGPGHGMLPFSSQNLIRPYPPGIVVARGLIRPYPFFFVLFFFFSIENSIWAMSP